MGIPTEDGWDCNLASVFNTCWCAHPSTPWHPPTSNTYGGTKQSGGEKEEKRMFFRRPEHHGSYHKSVVHVTALRSKDTKLPNAIVANFASLSLHCCITYQSYLQHSILEMCAYAPSKFNFLPSVSLQGRSRRANIPPRPGRQSTGPQFYVRVQSAQIYDGPLLFTMNFL